MCEARVGYGRARRNKIRAGVGKAACSELRRGFWVGMSRDMWPGGYFIRIFISLKI